MDWLRAAHCVFLCLTRASSNVTISPHQLAAIREAAHTHLLEFEDLLRHQEWPRLEPERTEVEDGRRDQWPRIFPHRLSGLLLEWILEPLTILLGDEPAKDAIPTSLVTTLMNAWSAVGRDFPSPLDVETINFIGVDTDITSIQPALQTLAALANTVREDGMCILISKSPC